MFSPSAREGEFVNGPYRLCDIYSTCDNLECIFAHFPRLKKRIRHLVSGVSAVSRTGWSSAGRMAHQRRSSWDGTSPAPVIAWEIAKAIIMSMGKIRRA
jgi:hypothetical protein